MAHNQPVDLGIDGLEDPVVVGEGGFALVYRAHQPAFRREVAVKVLTVGELDDEAAMRFERECQAMGAVSEHPHIVTVHDAGFTATGRPYLVMAYLPGGSLQERVDREGPSGWTAATLQGVHLAGALETAHHAGIVHRDVKPGNVLLSGYGEVQLTDFGIARIAGTRETARGVVTASVAHAAPEVVDGQRPSVAADVYSLASTLHELLAGRPAFVRPGDQSVLPVLRRIGDEAPPDLRPRGVPDEVVAVLERAMAKDPAERFATAAAFGRALQAARYRLDLDPGRLSIPPPASSPPPSPAGGAPLGAGTAVDTHALPGRDPGGAGVNPPPPSPPRRFPVGPGGAVDTHALPGRGPGDDGAAPAPPAPAGGTAPAADGPASQPGATVGTAPAADAPPPRATVRLDRHHLGRIPAVPPLGGPVVGPPRPPGGAPPGSPPPPAPGTHAPGPPRHAVVEVGTAPRSPSSGPVPGAPTGRPRPGPGSAGAVRRLAGAVVAVVLVGGAVVGGGALWKGRTTEPEPAPPSSLAVAEGTAVPSTGVPRYGAEYPASAERVFYEDCPLGHPAAYCDCLWGAVRENIPWAAYARIDQEIEGGKPWSETPLAGYIRTCARDHPS
jgi:hypothetical protein